MHESVVKEQLNIQVRGPNRVSNTYICKVIGDVMASAGVKRLEVINQFGDSLKKVKTVELGEVVKIQLPIALQSGVHIYADGPVAEPVIVFGDSESPDSYEDDRDIDYALLDY